ncbi:DUF5129 domain-containing protein [Corynebacterium mayonis]|uniref:DUF5129 domain-containing protein n=1 Tax=Corynebacterium mayonis TaxID=3062461 RepID=UPI003140B51C
MAYGKEIKEFAAVIGAATLIALGVGGAVAANFEVPAAEEVAVSAATQAPRLQISDPHNQLSPEDAARLERDASQLTFSDTVTTVHFLVFGDSRDNLNDTVEEYVRAHHPEAIGPEKFADGVLILSVATDKRNVGVYGGEDVDKQIKLRERVDEINEAMKPGMRDNNIPAGFIAGLRTAASPEKVQDHAISSAKSNRTSASAGIGSVSGIVSLAGGFIALSMRTKRRKAIDKAREQHALITREYAELGQRLDSIDIRANSLSSAFVDQQMRHDWAEVRERFLKLHDSVSGAAGVGSVDPNDDKQLYNNRAMLDRAYLTTTQVSNAEDNINRIFAVENGDEDARRFELSSLRKDIKTAVVDVHDETLRNRLIGLETQVEEMDRNPGAPGFVADYVRLLDDYGVLMQAVKQREFSDVKEHNALERPRIWDSGYYYPNYVPYVVLSNWHTSNVQAEQAAQVQATSSSNTSFSSGFSGAGGSSGY